MLAWIFDECRESQIPRSLLGVFDIIYAGPRREARAAGGEILPDKKGR